MALIGLTLLSLFVAWFVFASRPDRVTQGLVSAIWALTWIVEAFLL